MFVHVLSNITKHWFHFFSKVLANVRLSRLYYLVTTSHDVIGASPPLLHGPIQSCSLGTPHPNPRPLHIFNPYIYCNKAVVLNVEEFLVYLKLCSQPQKTNATAKVTRQSFFKVPHSRIDSAGKSLLSHFFNLCVMTLRITSGATLTQHWTLCYQLTG